MSGPETKCKTILITGVNGFVGSHLAEECASRGWIVHGTYRGFRSDLSNLKDLAAKPKLHPCEITDYVSVARIIREVRPDYVFHLAAQSYVPDSWSAPRRTMDANVIGTLNLLEAIQLEHPEAAFQFAGSSEEYGLVRPEDCPIDEDSPLRPLSPYGVSKVAGDLLVQQYAASYGIRAVVTRAFNHSGPRRGYVFAESNWCRQAAKAELGLGPAEIRHGNLAAIRDFSDVRDIVKGYILAIEKGKSGEVYQLTSGNGWAMGDILDTIISKARVKIKMVEDPARMRPSDVPRLIGLSYKAQKNLGWSVKIDFRETLSDILDYWREKLSTENLRRKETAGAAGN